jgi:hypothetical protein
MTDALLWWAVGGCLIISAVINVAALIYLLKKGRTDECRRQMK